MKITYVNCGLRIEYGSNPRSYEHFFSSSENEAYFHYYVSCVYGCKDRFHRLLSHNEIIRIRSSPYQPSCVEI